MLQAFMSLRNKRMSDFIVFYELTEYLTDGISRKGIKSEHSIASYFR
jgi:hypothetical protein